MTQKQVFVPSDKEIMHIISNGSDEERKAVSLMVGEYHPNFLFAQDVCFFLLESDNDEIRANALIGLSYLAKRFRKLNVSKMVSLIQNNPKHSKQTQHRLDDVFADISLSIGTGIPM